MSGLDVKQIAAGDHHSCVLTSFGDIYTWGRGDFGQLGHGNQVNPKPHTPNPKPQTPNPKPQTPNPKPSCAAV